MAERPENRVALALLERLDAPRMREASAWFDGGTVVSLRCGEFRVSRDVDFLCASNEGYRELRARVRGDGARGLFLRDVDLLREPRVDRYGIRVALSLGDVALKLESDSEGLIRVTPASRRPSSPGRRAAARP